MNIKTSLLVFVILIMLACQAINPEKKAKPTQETENESNQNNIDFQSICRQNVDRIRKLRTDFPTPDLLASKGLRADGDFDVNQYFSIFPHLKLEKGLQMDYAYDLSGMGGFPIIYTAPQGTPAFPSFQEYVDYAAKNAPDPSSYKPDEHKDDYLAHIQVDDSPEGYFQFLLMNIIGDQFYLVWHANYNDTVILCDASDMEEVAKEMAGFNLAFPKEINSKIKTIDFSPTVKVGETTVFIRLVQFSKWYGFRETEYSIGRKFPHQVAAKPYKSLVEYDCGIKF
jgi:hypothetical protein